ncbi:MAG TPA: hypothetical protein VHH90_08845 [Polyangia bacterium]|nr:hypothetical protein [Polyangia bacterium]
MSIGTHDSLQPASRGVGPLLQREYWAVIAGCRVRPSALLDALSERFWAFAPSDVVSFTRADGTTSPLERGDILEVLIRGAGTSRVCVVERSAQTLTLATMLGHPEAGRITFGAYRNPYGDVIFHVRSRARSSSRSRYAGFLMIGEAMQTATWVDFVIAVARTFGDGVVGYVNAETTRFRGRSAAEAEASASSEPATFLAEGD